MKIDKIIVIYAIISFIILIPFLTDKYIFTLDSVPVINNGSFYKEFYGFNTPVYGGGWILKIFEFIIPPFIFRKLLLFTILFLSGYSAYKLAEKFTNSKTARFYAGLLYMINPYTYIRIVVGHWLILFAYSLLPLAIKYFIELLENKDKKTLIKFTLIISLIAFNTHTLFITFIVLTIIYLCYLYKNKKEIKNTLKLIIISSIIFLIINTYWLIPTITSFKSSLITNISQQDLIVFSPKISSLFDLASMYGFWRPAYTYAKDHLPFWQILFFIIFFLSIYGFINYYNNKKIGKYTISFFIIWFLGLIFASGFVGPFKNIYDFLFNHLFLFKGMRDTQKFVTMLCLSYSILGALGLTKLQEEIKNPKYKKLITSLIILTPLIYSYTFFNSFDNQIKPTDFPKDWYEVNNFLNKDKESFRVLFFPWHLYMDFHWIPNKDKRIANPAPLFFDKEVISGKNIEIPGVYTQIHTPYQNYINFLLKNKDKIHNFGELTSILGVKYILLTKEADYKNYFFLFNQTDLKLVKETENFYVFKNKAFKGEVYSVNSIHYIKDWNELINLSNKEDISKILYILGSGSSYNNKIKYKKLNFTKISPIEYVINGKPLKYIIFTEEYSSYWVLNNEKPMEAYGVVNAYKAKNESKLKIVYEKFYKICLPSYIISLIAFISCLIYLIRDSYGEHK